MKAQPLPKSLYFTLKKAGIEKVVLMFSGGSDEGFLDVDFEPYDFDLEKPNRPPYTKFRRDIEEWAWGVYEYSGAGDGTDYGDTIIYDLISHTVEIGDWHMERVEGDVRTEDFFYSNEEE